MSRCAESSENPDNPQCPISSDCIDGFLLPSKVCLQEEDKDTK